MAEDLETRMRKFSLSEIENSEICLDDRDISSCVEDCSKSLFGKIFGAKKANYTGLKKTLSLIWPVKELFVTKEISFNYYQFVFASEEDKQRVANRRNWTFDNQYILLRDWAEGLNAQHESFNQMDMWVQVWNIPNNWICFTVGLKIGKAFVNVKDVITPEVGSLKGRHLKLLVTIEIAKPLIRG